MIEAFMQYACVKTFVKAATAIAAIMLLPACSSTYAQNSNRVTMAYETSGTVVIPPYTRTIFSSNNF